MSRVAGSYQSLIRGVSQQVPQDRLPGQHYEQVNMISDPVRGLARRHGSISDREFRIGAALSGSALTNVLADTANHKVYSFQMAGKDYDLIYRTQQNAGSTSAYWGWCYNKTDKVFIPVDLAASTTMTAALLTNGTAAVTAVGKYLFIVPNGVTTTVAGTDTWASWRTTLAAWVRSGAYSRTYKIRLTRASGAEVQVSYTTPSSSYPGVLDTSDIEAFDPPGSTTPNPTYNKQVNDRENSYNSAVTQWIGTAAAAITPQAIAVKLYQALVALGISGVGLSYIDSTVIIGATAMADPFVEIVCEDGGDGSSFRGVGSEIALADQVSTIHYPGKIIKVRPKKNDGTDVFYLKAYAKRPGWTDWGEVLWREASGYDQTPQSLWCMGIIQSGTLIIGGSAADLTAKAGGTHPTYSTNGSGDRTSNPAPGFIGRSINWIGLFQDRLCVASGATLSFSKSGDYQNFFRSSVLTLDSDEPVEMYALGSEDDTIKSATTYDRNLLLFGRRKQYVVSGRQPLTPTNASIVTQSSHEEAVDAFPINSGNFVFYNKHRGNVTTMHQIQIGQLADSPESYEVSQQLDRYLMGTPVELVATTAPNMVFVRTSLRNSLYVYTYLDSPSGSERLFDSWSTWKTNAACGWICGISQTQGDLLVYYIRLGSYPNGTQGTFISVDRFPLETGLSDYPYLDSLHDWAITNEGAYGSLSRPNPYDQNFAGIAFKNTTPEYMLGTTYNKESTLLAQYPAGTYGPHLMVGWMYDSYVTPTNPYILDSNGKAIITGRLTLTKVNVSVVDTGAMIGTVTSRLGTNTPTTYNGRNVGGILNTVGRQPLSDTSVSVPIGREVRDFTYTLSSDTWLPLTITAIEWSGQFFNNIRRG